MGWNVIAMSSGPLVMGLVLLAGYQWGRYAGKMALESDNPKWKAYLLALMPPAVFAAALLLDGALAPLVGQTFLALAAPAIIGACVRINYGSFSTF